MLSCAGIGDRKPSNQPNNIQNRLMAVFLCLENTMTDKNRLVTLVDSANKAFIDYHKALDKVRAAKIDCDVEYEEWKMFAKLADRMYPLTCWFVTAANYKPTFL